jgi:hypothetical protein
LFLGHVSSISLAYHTATTSTHANKAATMAKTPAPANVLSELAPPVGVADALLEEPVADFKAAEPEAEEPALALPVEVAVPVEVMVVMDPLEDMVEVTVEAVEESRLATWMTRREVANILDVIPEVEGVELEKDAEEVEDEPAAATLNCPD